MENKRSALIIIGNEILSGRTQDKNIQYIAEKMSAHGVPLSEVRVVPDIEDKIVETVNAMRSEYDFLFTTGGIGPTHDDITAASVAKAFGVAFDRNKEAYDILHSYYGDEDLTEARASMADMPVSDDLDLVNNPVSAAPGFRIGNVFVMAGVPKIMQGMLDHVLTMIEGGTPMLSRTVMVEAPESQIASILSGVQDEFPDIDIGSYPQFKHNSSLGGGWGVSVVLRGLDDAMLKQGQDYLVKSLQKLDFDVKVLS